jgi:hypothetical protein
MYERLLRETERYLERRKEIVVPVKQVWDVMVKEGRSSSFAVPSLMADFECLLEGDKRFEFVIEKKAPGVLKGGEDDFLEHEELEKLGFSDDQKVKLRRIPLSSADDEEAGDALDVAVSMEDLDKELTDASLFDMGPATATRGSSKTATTSPRSEKRKPSPRIARNRMKNVTAGGSRKAAIKKSPPKKRKK